MRAAALLFRSGLLSLACAVLAAPGLAAQNLPLTALPFLEISPSPAVNAIGGAGVALSEPDPHGFLYNPAHLGLAARDARALSSFYPGGTTDWLAVGDLSLGSRVLAAGIDAQVAGLPLSVGIGLGETALRFGERVAVDGRGEPRGAYEPMDRYRALALGAATTGAARVGLGATVRHVTSTDGVHFQDDGVATTNVWGFTFDLGVLAEADIAQLLGRPSLGPVQLALTVAVGYAQANLGGRVAYSGTAPTPLPRTARLGWSAQAGLDLPTDAGPFRLLGGTLAVQAEHSLVRHGEQPATYRYAALLGDLDLLRHGLLGDGSEVVTGRHGWRLVFAETVALGRGGFDGWGFSNVETRGLELRLAGPLKAAALLTGSPRLADLSHRFDFRYTHTVVFRGEPSESTFDGLSLVVRR